MIIGIDGREMEHKPTGVGTYLWNILQHLRLPQSYQLQLFFKNEVPARVASLRWEKVLLRSGGNNILWQQTHLPGELSRRNVRLFFSPAASCPLSFSGIQAVTVLDLSFFHHPEWFRIKERISRQMQLRLALKKADRVYVISDPIQKEVTSLFQVPEARIRLTPISVLPKTIDPEQKERLKRKHQLSDKKTILYVGSIFNRRHLPLVIEAFSGLGTDCVLVLIGENRTYPYQDLRMQAQKLGIENRLRLLEYVADDVLDEYYRFADVFIYLSTYEGFGIPPLEAMSYGIPAVLSETPVMDTVFRGAARFVSSFTSAEVRHALQECIENQELRKQLIEAGFALVSATRWENTAQMISKDWEQLIAG